MTQVEAEAALFKDNLMLSALQSNVAPEQEQQFYDRLATELLDTARLQQVSTLLIQEGDVDALYRRVLDAAVVLMGASMASMQLVDLDKGELRLLASLGFDPGFTEAFERVSAGTSCATALSAGHRVIVPDIEICDFIAGTPTHESHRKFGVRAVQSTPLVSRSGKILGMISTHWREPHQPSERGLRLLDVLARQAADLIERSQAETALRDSEERYRALFDAAPIAIFVCDRNAVIQQYNGHAVELWRREPVCGVERHCGSVKLWLPDGALLPHSQSPMMDVLRTGASVRNVEVYIERPDGSRLPVLVNFAALKNKDGEVTGAVTSFIDITERKRSEEQIAILAREAEHRAKNMLATVQATVRLSNGDTPEALKRAIEGRIAALANVHRLFVKSRWAGADLGSVVAQELAPYCQDGETRARFDGPHVMLEPDAAQTVAVTLHELATNGAKYGALSRPDGRVNVAWSHSADGRLVIRWTETGGPAVKPPTRQGFGTRVMENMVRRQLQGEMRFNWRADGLTCEIVLPA